MSFEIQETVVLDMSANVVQHEAGNEFSLNLLFGENEAWSDVSNLDIYAIRVSSIEGTEFTASCVASDVSQEIENVMVSGVIENHIMSDYSVLLEQDNNVWTCTLLDSNSSEINSNSVLISSDGTISTDFGTGNQAISFSFTSDGTAMTSDAISSLNSIKFNVSDATTMFSDIESAIANVEINNVALESGVYVPLNSDVASAVIFDGKQYVNGYCRIIVAPIKDNKLCIPMNITKKMCYFKDDSLSIVFDKETSYINSIYGMNATIPFHLEVNGESICDVEHIPLDFNLLQGEYVETGFPASMNWKYENYPTYWTKSGDSWNKYQSSPSSEESVRSIWDDVGVQYDSEKLQYLMTVPFGKQTTPNGKYIEIDKSVNACGGYYQKFVQYESNGDNVEPIIKYDKFSNSDDVDGFFAYKITDTDEETLYIRHARLYCIQQTTTSGDDTTTTYSYGFTVPSGASKIDSWLTWVVTSDVPGSQINSSNVKIIANTIRLYSVSGSDDGMQNDQFYKVAVNIVDPTSISIESIHSDKNPGNPEYAFSNGWVTNLNYFTYSNNEANATNVEGGSGRIMWGDGSSQHGRSNKIYFRIIDSNSNATNESQTTIKVHQTLPSDLSLTIIGSSGDSNFTGFYKKHGRFFPSEYISLKFSAKSDIDMTYQIRGTNSLYGDSSIKTRISGDLKTGVSYNHIVKINPIGYGSSLLFVNNLSNYNVNITFQVTDEAGNVNEITKKIRYINYLYRTNHLNLRETGADYSHSVFSRIDMDAPMNEKQVGTTSTRSWNEIWYPSTHGSPLNGDGTINETEALEIAKGTASADKLVKYDALALETVGGILSKDEDGRFLQNLDKWSLTKKYPAKENSKLVDEKYQTYWIIDNSGNPDFQLEFEVFDFSSDITKYPENLCARYTGDSLSVFDASNPECVESNPVVDEYGHKHWKLKNSSKLTHLFSLKGSYINSNNNPFTLLDSAVEGELTVNGSGFTCPPITQCSRICIVPFTDYGTSDDSRGSGFKLKAGPKHNDEYYNYEYVNEIGEFWIHRSPKSQNDSWESPSNIQILYDYYESTVSFDCDNGEIALNSRSAYPIIATFSHYLHMYSKDEPTNDVRYLYPYQYFHDVINLGTQGSIDNAYLLTHVASQDDFVDYQNKSIYIATGMSPDKNDFYDEDLKNSGKMTTGYKLDTDTGIVTLSTRTPPLGRIFADYYYHTFYRLTSDGYGDLYFYGTGILVPATSTDSFYDWTHVDVKIVNEGGNTLNNGLLSFLSRGYVTKGTVVDTVLDQNRPWDIQEGTTAETVNRTGAKCEREFANLPVPSRKNAFSARSSQSCSLGDIEPKQAVYVRVFWCIANDAEGTSWVDTTKGYKTYSAELTGSYYIFSS